MWAHAALEITYDQPRTNLTPYVSVFEDPTASMSAADVAKQPRQAFKPVEGLRANLGKSQSAYWFSLDLKVLEPSQGHVEVAYALLDNVQVFEVRNHLIHAHAQLGDAHSWYARVVPNRHFWTPVSFAPGDVRLLIRVQTTSTFYVPLHYSSHLISSGEHEIMNTLNGVFYGLLAAMFVYNLAIFLSLREATYGWFLLHIATLISLALHLDGFLYRLTPNAILVQHIASAFLMFMYGISALQFSRHYLSSAKHLTRVDPLLIALLWGQITLLLSGALLPFTVWSQIASASLFITALVLVGLGWLAWRRQTDYGTFYFLTSAAVLSTVALAAGSSLGIKLLDVSGAHIVRVGLIAQAFLLSMGLAKRIQTLRQQSQIAQLQALQAQEANQAKSRFLAKVSHEIRTPLNAVLGMAEMLKETPLVQQQQFYVNAIERSGASLLTVMNDIIDYARIESGKLRIECIEFDLEALLDQVLQPFAQSLQDKQLNCYVALAPNVPRWVHGDPTRINQVLTNLLHNALKFTEHGSIALSVSSVGDSIVLCVKDTGAGISLDAQQRIFQAFDQAETSTTRCYGGSGLGLSICHELVGLMNGRISVTSEPKQGACFVVTLPLLRPTEPQPEAALQTHCKVLLVGNDALSQQALALTLERFATHVFVATIQTLAEQIERWQPDWLLINHQAPLALETLLQNRPNLKVLLSSPLAISQQLERCYVLHWPCDLAGLRRHLLDRPQTTSTTAKARIWVVDDLALNRELLNAQLHAQGHQCRLFARSQDLLDAYCQEPNSVDILLLDGQMPELDGFNLSSKIRQFEHSAKRIPIPIVVLSALSIEEAAAHLDTQHIDAFLTKPVDIKRLQAVLAKLLSAQAAPQVENHAYNTAFAQAYYAHTPHAVKRRGFAKSD